MKALNYPEAKEKIQVILGRHEYQAYHKDSQTLWERFLNKLNDWINSLSKHLNLSHATSTFVLYAIIGILILIISGVIIMILFRYINEGKRRDQKIGTAYELADSVTSHLEKSQVAFNNGDTFMAVRYAFLALIRQLDDAKWIEAKTWKTNREYHEEILSKDIGMAQNFYPLANFFDQTIYGGETPESEVFFNYWSAVRALIEQTTSPRSLEGIN